MTYYLIEEGPIRLARITEYTSSGYDLTIVYEIDAVVDHIIKTLFILRGTYVWDPEFGSDLLKYLFEPLDDTTLNQIKHEIDRVARSHPSVEDVIIDISNVSPDQKLVTIDVTLVVSGEEKRFTLTSNATDKTIKVTHY